MQLFDTFSVDAKAGARITRDGYLVATPRVARTGIQQYAGYEVGKKDMKVVNVYRPEAEVFNKDAMAGLAFRPITDDHPSEPVTADNWKDLAVGTAGGDIARDGEFVRLPMSIMDAEVIQKVRDGKAQLSVGYTCDLKWEPGVTEDGQKYDAIQTNIRANHIAIVDFARGGDKLKIGDDQSRSGLNGQDGHHSKEKPMTERNLITMVVDGIGVEMTDTAQAVVKRHIAVLSDANDALTKSVQKLTDDLTALTTQHATDAATHKKDIEAKDAQIATLTKQLEDAKLTPAKLDALVKDRAGVVAKAKAVLGDKLVVDDKTDGEIRRQVVDAHMGDTAKAWTDDQVTISFDSITKAIKVDGSQQQQQQQSFSTGFEDMRQAMMQNDTSTNDERMKPYNAYEDRITNAWKDASTTKQ